MIEEIKKFIKEAGQYSVEKSHRSGHKLGYKFGGENLGGLVTEVDLAISEMFKEFVEKHFSNLNYIIIDEESIDNFAGNLFEATAKSEYQFVIDPIDGTVNYAADVPLYGISIGVMKNGQPLYGFLYAPAFDELVYSDGEQVYFERGEYREIIEKAQKTTSKIIQGHQWNVDVIDKILGGKFVIGDYFSAVIYLLYLALGRIKGCFMRANLWDIAAGLVICRVLGMGFYDYENGKELYDFVPEDFMKTGKVKRLHIVGFRDEMSEIKAITTGLK